MVLFKAYNTTTHKIAGSSPGFDDVNLNDQAASAFGMLFVNGYTYSSQDSARSDITANVVSGRGTNDGHVPLTNVDWIVDSSGTARWDSADVSVRASGSVLAADGFIIFANVSGEPLLFYIDNEGTSEASDGTDFIVQAPSTGWFDVKPSANP